jgi:hypothetical protein
MTTIPTFSEASQVQHAIEIVVSACHRTRSDIDVSAVVRALRATFRDNPTADDDLAKAILKSALKADVPIRNEVARQQHSPVGS